MSREEFYKRYKSPVKEGVDFIEELYAKSITGDELAKAYREKFVDEDKIVQRLIRNAKAYEKEGKGAEAIQAIVEASDIRPKDKEIRDYKLFLLMSMSLDTILRLPELYQSNKEKLSEILNELDSFMKKEVEPRLDHLRHKKIISDMDEDHLKLLIEEYLDE